MATLIIATDGGARGNPGPSALGFCVTDERGRVIHEHAEYLGEGTNNEAEYRAFITSAQWVRNYTAQTGDLSLVWQLDSLLVVEQLNQRWRIKEPRLRDLANQAWGILAVLPYPYQIRHVLRAENKRADALVNEALDSAVSDG